MHKVSLILFLAGLLGPAAVLGRTKPSGAPFSRTVTKTFQVSNGAALDIENKYGKVSLTTWNKNEIRAVVTITANASSEENARQLAGQVNIQADQSGNNLVKLSTTYESGQNSSFWKRFFGGLSASPGRSVRIDYEVTIPRSLASTSIRNNYGDVVGSDIPGNVSLSLNYGHFHLSRVGGTLNLNVNYCEGTLSDINGGVIQGNYTHFQLDQVSNLKIQSNYSDYKIATGTKVDLHANYGNFAADHLGGFTSRSNYTDYKIETLGGASDMQVTYGNIRIGSLAADFSGLNIKGTYGDASVGVPASRPVRVDVQLVKGDIHVSGLDLQQVERNSNHGNETLSGNSRGAGPDAPLIKVNGTYTNVSLTRR